MRAMFKMILIAMFVTMCAIFMSAACVASPQAPGQSNNSGFVSYTEAQRAVTFSESRQWQSTSGQILVCPHTAETGSGRKCYTKGNEGDSQWISIEQYAQRYVPDGVIAGFQYSYAGSAGYQQLTVYFRIRLLSR
jgi:hypothetical protein